MSNENTDAAQEVLQGLIDNVRGKVSGALYGWVLDAIGMGGGSDPVIDRLDRIQQTLNLIETQIVALQQELKDVERQIILAVEWNTQTAAMLPAVNRIEFKYSQLSTLRKDDQEAAQELQRAILDDNLGVGPDLDSINSLVLDAEGGVSPGQAGLLNMWINACTDAAMASFQRGNVGPGSPLDVAAHNITRYFVFLVVQQLKGVTLLVNADTAAKEVDQSQVALSTYLSRINAQAVIYRAGMENLLLKYCPDQTLLGLFSGPYWQSSPLLLADGTICGLIAEDELVLRVWGGSSTGAFPFDTGTLITDGRPGPALVLEGDGAQIASLTATGDYTLFPANNGSQWSMYRYRFPRPQPGTYSVNPGVPLLPFFNCHVDPTNFFDRFAEENPVILLAPGERASSVALTFTGVQE